MARIKHKVTKKPTTDILIGRGKPRKRPPPINLKDLMTGKTRGKKVR